MDVWEEVHIVGTVTTVGELEREMKLKLVTECVAT
jgi:hypothetical protein